MANPIKYRVHLGPHEQDLYTFVATSVSNLRSQIKARFPGLFDGRWNKRIAEGYPAGTQKFVVTTIRKMSYGTSRTNYPIMFFPDRGSQWPDGIWTGRRRYLNTAIVGSALDMHASGSSWVEIADTIGAKPSAVRRACLNRGASKTYNKVTPEAIERARWLRAEGCRWKDIGRVLNQNWATLSNHISREDVANKRSASAP